MTKQRDIAGTQQQPKHQPELGGTTGAAVGAERSTRPINVVVITPRLPLRRALTRVLKDDPRCRLVAVGAHRIPRVAGAETIDAVILDHLAYGGDSMPEVLRAARGAVLIALLKQSELLAAMNLLYYADGFLFVDHALRRTPEVVQCALAGYCLLPPSMSGQNPVNALRLSLVRDLTDDELEIVRSLGRGLSNREIAEETGFSESRVKSSLRVILQKLCLQNRTEAAVFYVCNRGALEAEAAAAREQR